MDPRQLFFDERLVGGCVYCGAQSETRDHVPSRVLLDEPFPPDLPVVGACASCNNGFSPHERVVACLVDCTVRGSSSAIDLRPKVKRMLAEDPRLAAQMDSALGAGRPRLFDHESVGQVVTKLAKGHLAFMEYPTSHEPARVRVAVRAEMGEGELRHFDVLPTQTLFPEIGTRGFMVALRAIPEPPLDKQSTQPAAGWSVVQEGRYRYAVLLGQEHPTVRIVLSEYLLCEASW